MSESMAILVLAGVLLALLLLAYRLGAWRAAIAARHSRDIAKIEAMATDIATMQSQLSLIHHHLTRRHVN